MCEGEKTSCCKFGNVLRYTYNQGGRHLPDITLTFVWPVKIADWVVRECALRMRMSTQRLRTSAFVTMAKRERVESTGSNHGNRSRINCGGNSVRTQKMANK